MEIKPVEFYETCFRSLMYAVILLIFCFTIEKSNVKIWLIVSCMANGTLKLILAGCSGYRLSNNYNFRLNLLDECLSIFRVIVFTSGIVSIFHWNERSSALIKMLLFITAELLAFFVLFLAKRLNE
jgi:hypothetical protein